jgi:hypothetical protein
MATYIIKLEGTGDIAEGIEEGMVEGIVEGIC